MLKFNEVSLNMFVGDSYSLLSLLQIPNGYTNNDVTWESSNNEKVTVNIEGVITGIEDGYATISAICDGKVATIKIYVDQKKDQE